MKKSKLIISILIIIAIVFAGFSAYAADNEQVTQENDAKIVREIVEKRTLSSRAYEMSDGTVMHELFATDIHYKDESGKLKEIDIKVKDIDTAKNNGYKFKNSENDWDIYFSDKGKAKDLVEINQGNYSISFSMDKVKSEAKASKATQMEKGRSELHDFYSEDPTVVMYTDAMKNVDLAYTIREHYLKEDIILKAVPETNEFTFTLTTKNIGVVLKDNKLYYNDAKSGENVFFTENLFMEDSNGKMSTDVSMKLESLGDGKYSLTVIADEKFLNDSETVYPVVIDPDITIQNVYTKDVYVASYMSTTNMNALSTRMPYLRTGKDSAYGIRRIYIEFRDSDIAAAVGPNDDIVAARVSLKRYSSSGTINLYAYEVTESWTSGSGGNTHIYWNDYTSYDYATAYSDYSANDWYSMYITDLVQGWENGSINNYGVMIKDYNESSASTWATFRSSDNSSTADRPKLVIYTTSAATPTPTPTATPTPIPIPTIEQDRFYSEYDTTIYNTDFMKNRMNCYGYASQLYYVGDSIPYLQQPGEFAINSEEYSNLMNSYYNAFYYWMNIYEFVDDRVFEDYDSLGWDIQETTRTAVVPEGKRKIALVFAQDGVYRDYHFFLRHDDGTWSHKPGQTEVTNKSTNSNVTITDSNIDTTSQEGIYDDGIRYYLIEKDAVLDYPHNYGHYSTTTYTTTDFSDKAGDEVSKCTEITGDVSARFDYAEDIDFYMFSPTTSKSYSFYTSCGVGYDVDGVVYDGNETVLAYDDTANNASFSAFLTAGNTYYIAIWDCEENIEDYTLYCD